MFHRYLLYVLLLLVTDLLCFVVYHFVIHMYFCYRSTVRTYVQMTGRLRITNAQRALNSLYTFNNTARLVMTLALS